MGRLEPPSLLTSFISGGTSTTSLLSNLISGSTRNLNTSQTTVGSEDASTPAKQKGSEGSFRHKDGSNGNVATSVDTKVLEEELSTLRECTREALLKSWNETETLHEHISALEQVISKFEDEVSRFQMKEKYWRERCLQAEKQLTLQANISKTIQAGRNSIRNVQQNGMGSSSLHGANSVSSSKHGKVKAKKPLEKRNSNGSTGLFARWTKGASQENVATPTTMQESTTSSHSSASAGSATSSLSDNEKEQEEQANEYQYPDKIEEKDEMIQELKAKVASRDSAIVSLEQTVDQHVKTMQTAQEDMSTLIEKLREKEDDDKQQKREKKQMERKMKRLRKSIEKKEDEIEERNEMLANLAKGLQSALNGIGEMTSKEPRRERDTSSQVQHINSDNDISGDEGKRKAKARQKEEEELEVSSLPNMHFGIDRVKEEEPKPEEAELDSCSLPNIHLECKNEY